MIERKQQALADAKQAALALEDAARGNTAPLWSAVRDHARTARESARAAGWREGETMAERVRDEAQRILRTGVPAAGWCRQ